MVSVKFSTFARSARGAIASRGMRSRLLAVAVAARARRDRRSGRPTPRAAKRDPRVRLVPVAGRLRDPPRPAADPRAAASRVRRPAMPTAAPAPADGDAGAGGGEDSSPTNVQEAGVDEPDTVKTDGKDDLGDRERDAARRRRARGDADAAQHAPARRGLRHDDAAAQGPRAAARLRPARRALDRGRRRRPRQARILRTEDVDGHIVDARLTGRSVRIVVSSYPVGIYAAGRDPLAASGLAPGPRRSRTSAPAA